MVFVKIFVCCSLFKNNFNIGYCVRSFGIKFWRFIEGRLKKVRICYIEILKIYNIN